MPAIREMVEGGARRWTGDRGVEVTVEDAGGISEREGEAW